MTIEALQLAEPALSAAYKLKEACPWIVFVSGRRDWYGQAHAMAQHVMDNQKWIELTYVGHPSLQAAIDKLPATTWQEDTGVYQIAEALYQVFALMPTAEKDKFPHPQGLAFDLSPVFDPPTREQTIKAVYALPALKQFLLYEGGKELWHVEFSTPVSSVAV